jgi:hypothetical protein
LDSENKNLLVLVNQNVYEEHFEGMGKSFRKAKAKVVEQKGSYK